MIYKYPPYFLCLIDFLHLEGLALSTCETQSRDLVAGKEEGTERSALHKFPDQHVTSDLKPCQGFPALTLLNLWLLYLHLSYNSYHIFLCIIIILNLIYINVLIDISICWVFLLIRGYLPITDLLKNIDVHLHSLELQYFVRHEEVGENSLFNYLEDASDSLVLRALQCTWTYQGVWEVLS